MTIKDIKGNTYFKLVNSKGKYSNKVYKKCYYERSIKKYCIVNVEDLCDDKLVKSTQEVTTEFIY